MSTPAAATTTPAAAVASIPLRPTQPVTTLNVTEVTTPRPLAAASTFLLRNGLAQSIEGNAFIVGYTRSGQAVLATNRHVLFGDGYANRTDSPADREMIARLGVGRIANPASGVNLTIGQLHEPANPQLDLIFIVSNERLAPNNRPPALSLQPLNPAALNSGQTQAQIYSFASRGMVEGHHTPTHCFGTIADPTPLEPRQFCLSSSLGLGPAPAGNSPHLSITTRPEAVSVTRALNQAGDTVFFGLDGVQGQSGSPIVAGNSRVLLGMVQGGFRQGFVLATVFSEQIQASGESEATNQATIQARLDSFSQDNQQNISSSSAISSNRIASELLSNPALRAKLDPALQRQLQRDFAQAGSSPPSLTSTLPTP